MPTRVDDDSPASKMKLRVIVQIEGSIHRISCHPYIYVYVDANAWRILPGRGGADECKIYTTASRTVE